MLMPQNWFSWHTSTSAIFPPESDAPKYVSAGYFQLNFSFSITLQVDKHVTIPWDTHSWPHTSHRNAFPLPHQSTDSCDPRGQELELLPFLFSATSSSWGLLASSVFWFLCHSHPSPYSKSFMTPYLLWPRSPRSLHQSSSELSFKCTLCLLQL